MELIIIEVHHYKIKKQNSKMYYITFTGPYKYFRRWFLQGSTFCCQSQYNNIYIINNKLIIRNYAF